MFRSSLPVCQLCQWLVNKVSSCPAHYLAEELLK